MRRWAPDAKVTECVDGKVSLPSILDVELAPQPEGKIGHDWDSAARPFLLSSTGGGLRKKSEGSTATAGPFVIDPSKRTSHRNRNAAAAAAATDAVRVRVRVLRRRRAVAREVPTLGREGDPARGRPRERVRAVRGGARVRLRLSPLRPAADRARARRRRRRRRGARRVFASAREASGGDSVSAHRSGVRPRGVPRDAQGFGSDRRRRGRRRGGDEDGGKSCAPRASDSRRTRASRSSTRTRPGAPPRLR